MKKQRDSKYFSINRDQFGDDIVDEVLAELYARERMTAEDEETEEYVPENSLQFQLEMDEDLPKATKPNKPQPNGAIPRSERCEDFTQFIFFATSPHQPTTPPPTPKHLSHSLTPEPQIEETGVFGILGRFIFGSSSEE